MGTEFKELSEQQQQAKRWLLFVADSSRFRMVILSCDWKVPNHAKSAPFFAGSLEN